MHFLKSPSILKIQPKRNLNKADIREKVGGGREGGEGRYVHRQLVILAGGQNEASVCVDRGPEQPRCRLFQFSKPGTSPGSLALSDRLTSRACGKAYLHLFPLLLTGRFISRYTMVSFSIVHKRKMYNLLWIGNGLLGQNKGQIERLRWCWFPKAMQVYCHLWAFLYLKKIRELSNWPHCTLVEQV